VSGREGSRSPVAGPRLSSLGHAGGAVSDDAVGAGLPLRDNRCRRRDVRPACYDAAVTHLVPAPPRVVSYQRMWPLAYEQEARLLRAVLHGLEHRIEHVGSTAVPGLPAKPVIDVMIGQADYRRFDALQHAIEGLGYVRDLRAEADEPARKVFRKGPGDHRRLRTHHLHVTEEGGDYWRRLLAFRDELRRNREAAAEYTTVKLELLRNSDGDSRAYTRGKREIVKKVERVAGVDVP
jgi:GrpB-like predicted nucleotidyltransferase (UPF0157 family)